MKKWLFLLLVFLSAVSFGWAENRQFGAGLSIDLDGYTAKDTSGDKSQTNSLSFQPFLSIMLNEKMELVPFLTLYTSAEKTNGEIDVRWTFLGIGSSFYYHFVNTNVISLGAGVKVRLGYGYYPETSTYDSYMRIAFNASVPLFMDLNMTDRLTFRFTWDALSLSLYKSTYDTGSGEQSEAYAYMDSPLDVENLTLGFLIRF